MKVGIELSSWYDRMVEWLVGPGLYAVVVGVLAVVSARLLRLGISRLERRFAFTTEDTSDREKRVKALTGFLATASSIAVYLVAAVSILDRFGVRTASLLASLGIAGIAVGFGAQTLIRDLIAGLFILAEGQISIGDSVKLFTASGPVSGTVERISVRTTTVRGAEGEAQIVPNGEIRYVANYSKEWAKAVVDVQASPEVAPEVGQVLARVAAEMYDDEGWQRAFLAPPEYLGVEELQKDSARLRVVARVMPSRKAEVARALRLRILEELARENLIASVSDE